MPAREFLHWTFHLAVHESAHAVVAVACNESFVRVEIFPGDRRGYIHTKVPPPRVTADYPKSVPPIIAGFLAGSYAGAQIAPDLARSARGNEGDYCCAKEYAAAVANHDPVKTAEVLRSGAELAERLVRERWEAVRVVAVALLRHRALDEEQVRKIIKAQSKAKPGPKRTTWYTPIGWPLETETSIPAS